MACHSTAGFAAIGIGKSHAESLLMFSGHSPMKPFTDTALLVYAAKKRAEVAPGVGKETDICFIGPALGSFYKIEDKHIAELEAIYQKMSRANERTLKRAQLETKKYNETIQNEYVAAQLLAAGNKEKSKKGAAGSEG